MLSLLSLLLDLFSLSINETTHSMMLMTEEALAQSTDGARAAAAGLGAVVVAFGFPFARGGDIWSSKVPPALASLFASSSSA